MMENNQLFYLYGLNTIGLKTVFLMLCDSFGLKLHAVDSYYHP